MTTYEALYKELSGTIKTIYTVEYIDNEKDFNKLRSGKCPAPWELFKTKTFNNIGEAVSYYICCEFNDNIFECKLFEEIQTNGETVRESWVELYSTLKYSIGTFIDRDRENKIVRLTDNLKEISQECQMYKDFVSCVKLDDQFNEFCKLERK